MGKPSHAFLEFFFALREHRVDVSPDNWVALMEALAQGLHRSSLDGFYRVSRCVLVSKESQYDAFDQAFAQTFRGVASDREKLLHMLSGLDDWLRDPKRLAHLDPQLFRELEHLDLEELRRQLLERLAEQNERHEGGSRWIGSGGTSPFGTGGQHPTGVRIGGGGGRSALAVADARRFRAHRNDLVLDTRQIAGALRRLRRLTRTGNEEELDLDATVDETARNCGDLEVVMRPPKKNDVRVMLLLDVGGSMDPHAHLVSRLFSAAHRGGGFKELRHYYFHNCVYRQVYEDARFTKAVEIQELFRRPGRWYLVIVGDAWMHPAELGMTGGGFWSYGTGPSGLTCLAKLADRFPRSAWLNPEPETMWDAPTIRDIGQLFPMFPLTLRGLEDMVGTLRRPAPADRRRRVQRVAAAS